MRKVHAQVMVTMMSCCVINYCHGMSAPQIRQAKELTRKQLATITSSPLNIPSFDKAWQIILTQQAIPRLWDNAGIGELAEQLCKAVPQNDLALRQHVVTRVSELAHYIPESSARIRQQLLNPELVHNLQLWADFIKKTQRILTGLKGESDRRKRTANGTLEYQHIAPWREKWDLLKQCAALAATLKSVPTVASAAAQVANPFNDAEVRWEITVDDGVHALTCNIYTAVNKLDDAILWDQRAQEAAENQVVMRDYFAKVDEARAASNKIANEWNYYGEVADLSYATKIMNEVIPHLTPIARSCVATEFTCKATAATIKAICDHLATPFRERNFGSLTSLQKQLAQFLTIIKPLAPMKVNHDLTNRSGDNAEVSKQYMSRLPAIFERLQANAVRRQTQPAPVPTMPAPYVPYPAPTQQVPSELMHIITLQSQQISSLMALQKAQQEQINELLKRLPAKY